MSTANRLRQEGRAEGKAEARTRLLRQLAARFGTVPTEIEDRVQRAGSADLDLWAIRLLQAQSLLEVFERE
jgi:hypothetical protein